VKKSMKGVWIVAGLVALAPAYGHQSATLQAQMHSLQVQLQSLQAQVQGLQAQVAQLKAQRQVRATPVTQTTAPQATVAAPASPQNQLAVWNHKWRQIRDQMTKPQVLSLLGKPQQILQTGTGPVWYYHYSGVGSGSVAFDNDMRVLAWQRPPFGHWW